MCGVRKYSNFILLYVAVQFSQHHLLKFHGFQAKGSWNYPDSFPRNPAGRVSCSVAQSCLTLHNPVGCSLPGSSILLCQIILQSYNHQDRMVLAQKQKYRHMEQDRKHRNKPMHLWVPYFQQRRQEYTMGQR